VTSTATTYTCARANQRSFERRLGALIDALEKNADSACLKNLECTYLMCDLWPMEERGTKEVSLG
jgi:hypothetical protein